MDGEKHKFCHIHPCSEHSLNVVSLKDLKNARLFFFFFSGLDSMQ